MAWTAAEDIRVTEIEKVVNKLQLAVTKLASQQQLRSIIVLKQKEIDDLIVRLNALEAQVAILQQGT